jgi:hypothetical protein
MADKPTLAELLMRQDLGALGASLAERTEPHPFSSQLNPTRRAVEAPLRDLQWAALYPMHAWMRWDRENTIAGNPPSWPPNRNDGSRGWQVPPIDVKRYAPSFQAIGQAVEYSPGPRESDMVEDRRGPWWQYK